MPSLEVESLLFSAAPGWNGQNGKPQVVTYSFEQDGTEAFDDPWAPFNAAQQDAARAALARWAAASGLTFIEVPDTAGGKGIDIRFGLHTLPSKYVGLGYLPRQGDVAVDLSYRDRIGPSFDYVLLHEIGHAIGLKHPFEDGTILPYFEDNQDNTVMSYTRGPSGSLPTGLGPFDVQAAQYIYGTPADKAVWPVQYGYDARLGAVRMDVRPGDVAVTGTDYRDAVFGTAGDKTIRTGSGDDLIHPGAGSNTIDAGDGRDALDLGTTRLQATLDVRVGGTDPGGWTDRQGTVSIAGETDRFSRVERIAFIDGHLSYTAEDPDAQVARLYRAALGRAPDADGLAYWSGRVAEGASLPSLAQGFVGAPEFQARFGVPDDAGFVARLYRNVLGRDPDAAGLAFWRGRLQSGDAGRADVLAGISESAENKQATAALVQDGLWVEDRGAAAVARLYDTVLDRLPDAGGLAFWVGQLRGGASLHDVAARFVASPEFQARFGAPDGAGFIQALYLNVLGRPGEAAGAVYWTGVLDGGRDDRAGVVLAFSESREHQIALAPRIDGGIVTA